MSYGLCTDVGMVRENNEDFILIDDASGIYIVADGMGGYKGGEIASREASLFMLSYIKRAVLASDVPKQQRQGLIGCFHETNRHIAQLAKRDVRINNMGTTAVVAIRGQGHFWIGHVGDSRAYLVHEGEVRQLTKDHTFVQELIDHGTITEEEAEHHPKRHVVTQALGSDYPVSPEVLLHRIKKSGVLLLCSDGLSGLVPPAIMRRIIWEQEDLQVAAEQLVAEANARGGQDNISVVLVALEPDTDIEKR